MTDVTQAAPAERSFWTRATLAAAATLAALIGLADVLFFSHEPGVSLTLMFAGLIVGVSALFPQRWREPRTVGLAAVALLAALPFAESENLFWVPPALTAVSLLALALSGQLPQFEDWLGTLTRFAVLAPVRLIGDGFGLLGEAGQLRLGGQLLKLALVWVVPIGCAVVFAFLFVAANPVLELGFHAIRLEFLFQLLDPLRVFIWGFVALVCWPVLVPRLLGWSTPAQMQGPTLPRPESLIFGAQAIRNSLIVFNAIFAVQTLMDVAYLWGGLRLPDGMTHADYAHRGAYPLIATAVLAGAFVLAAMHKNGPGRTSPLIRGLVFAWIGQNVWLVISSILRLKIYVEAYSLTELRIAAGIWMLLVAVGLVLIVGKIVFDRSNRWLVMSNLVALAVTLFGVSWLDFPAVISAFNVAHSYEVTGDGQHLDFYYMDDLGRGVIPALDTFLLTAKYADADTLKTFRQERDMLALSASNTSDWQSWTWRAERLRAYVAAHPYAPDAARAIN